MENNLETTTVPAAPEPAHPARRVVRRGAMTLLLALGLLAVGGVAVVNAQSPDPAASPAASPSTEEGTTEEETREGHDCPERDDATDSSDTSADESS